MGVQDKVAEETSVKGKMKKVIKSAMCFNNGNIAVFDAKGNQIPELQRSWPNLWCEHAERMDYDPNGVVFDTQAGVKFKIFRCADGGFNRDIIS